jgi:hypothetical protein
VLDAAAQPHRVMAVARLCDQLHPAVIARTSAGDCLGHHIRQHIADKHRLGHPVPSNSRSVGASGLSEPRKASQRRANSAKSWFHNVRDGLG